MPEYLWYALGEKQSVPREEDLLELFWGDRGPNFGDFELHRSEHPEIGTILRIRNPQQFSAEVTIAGVRYPLCQTGYRDPWGGVDPQPMVNFVRLYDELTCPG